MERLRCWMVLAGTSLALTVGHAPQAVAAPSLTRVDSTRVAQARSRTIDALKQNFMGLATLLKSPKWGDYSWEHRVKFYKGKVERSLADVRRSDPGFDVKRAEAMYKKMLAFHRTKGGQAKDAGVMKAMRAHYKAAADLVGHWPYSLHATSLKQSCVKNTYIDNIKALNWQTFKKRLAADQTKHARLFVYTSSGTAPDGLPQKRASQHRFHSDDERAINRYIVKIFQWKQKLAKSSRELGMNIQSAIVEVDKAHKGSKVDCSIMAVKMANAVLSLQPDNMHASDLRKDAIRLRKKTLRKMGKYITGSFHADHMREIVLFKAKPTIGREANPGDDHTIVPGQPTFLVGYFPATMNDTGGAPSLVFQVYKDGKLESKHIQQMYRMQKTKKRENDAAHYVFDLFPNPAKTKFRSHLEYLPALHFTKWLLYQGPGKYKVKFTWGRTKALASGTFNVDLSRANRTKLRTYYDSLMAAKIKSVTFPKDRGCRDARRKITNVSHLKKYGKLLKVSLSGTGNIMKPWPRQREVDWNTARGWGAFVNSDSKLELIPLEFRKRPRARRWNWHSIAFKPSTLGLSGPTSVSPALLDYGWEASKAGIKKCTTWM